MEMNFCGVQSPIADEAPSQNIKSTGFYRGRPSDDRLTFTSMLSPGSFASEDEEDLESPRRQFVNIKGLTKSYSSTFDSPGLYIPEYGSDAIEKLALRLEQGFFMNLHDETVDDVFLFLDKSRTALHIRKDWDEKKEVNQYWASFPLDKILRLEIGKSSKHVDSVRSFTIIVNEDADISYYDFETRTPIDREILLSALMVVLEQVHQRLDKAKELRDCSLPFGSLNQPILCSPSLEKDFDLERPFPHLSPRRTTQIYESDEGLESTETSLVKENGIIMIKSTEDEDHEDQVLEKSSFHHQQSVPWCSHDVCSSALVDIANRCSRIFALRQGVDSRGCIQGDEQTRIVEDYFAAVLGAPTAMFTFVTGDVWSASEVKPVKEGSSIRNRATLLNAQANRLRALQNEMTFAAAVKESKKRIHRTTQSFDNLESIQAGVLSKQLFKSPLLRQAVGTMTTEIPDDDVAYYDSDPEDSRPRTIHRGPRHIRQPSESIGQVKTKFDTRAFDRVVPSEKRVSHMMNDEVIFDIVQAMTNERLMLMFHEAGLAPVCCKVWIESGITLMDGTFVLPKLCWSPSHSRKSNEYIEKMTKLDLLDICRVLPLESRVEHSFLADPRRSFTIQTNSRSYLMEAESSDDRDRIVYGLKLVIARLASLLMLRDHRAVEEFFGSIQEGAPGEAPGILSGEAKE